MSIKKIIWTCLILLLGLMFTFVESCKPKETKYSVPVVTTSDISKISPVSASSGGNITDDGGQTVISRGVCWSTVASPGITDNKTTDGTGGGSYTSSISGLTPNVTYYVRAYATNNVGTGYGNTVTFTSQGPTGTITDIDGNVYHYLTIGAQVWTVENLRATHYSNGDAIQYVTDSTPWSGLTTGAYCNYNNDNITGSTYGHLYNWYAVNDGRSIAPAGWHLPNDGDWITLTDYLGGANNAGIKLKETGTSHWLINAGATNESGFTALPGGGRTATGRFFDIRAGGYWWSTSEIDPTTAWCRFMSDTNAIVNRAFSDKREGYAVRCLRDL